MNDPNKTMSDILQSLGLTYDIHFGRIVMIKRVIFNAPATIVFWLDGSKTVVKAQNGEPFDKEKGLAMAICKKLYGNRGSYFDIFKEWCREEVERHERKGTKR